MLHYTLNNQPATTKVNTSIKALLQKLIKEEQPFAVAVNKTILPSNQFELTLIHSDDVIDVLTPMQGG